MSEPPPDRDRDDPRSVVLRDARAIRALAHPARLAILRVLLAGQELTATECSSATGLSPSATSYHLKALERWGIVTPGEPRTDGRQRPWRATGVSIDLESPTPAATGAAEAALVDVILDNDRAAVHDYIRRQGEEPQQWRDTVTVLGRVFLLTAEEVDRITADIGGILEPYRGRTPPEGARPVRVSLLTVPVEDPRRP